MVISTVGMHEVPLASPGQEYKVLSCHQPPQDQPYSHPASAPVSFLALRQTAMIPSHSLIYVHAQNAPFHPACVERRASWGQPSLTTRRHPAAPGQRFISHLPHYIRIIGFRVCPIWLWVAQAVSYLSPLHSLGPDSLGPDMNDVSNIYLLN